MEKETCVRGTGTKIMPRLFVHRPEVGETSLAFDVTSTQKTAINAMRRAGNILAADGFIRLAGILPYPAPPSHAKNAEIL